MLAEFIMQEGGEENNTAATRIWSASECLRKAGIESGCSLNAGFCRCKRSGATGVGTTNYCNIRGDNAERENQIDTGSACEE